ncbi:hypothetical protein EV356DRAFT_248584 [Viridothelium virens]|uniref:Uncharacterized protein n=1 Tax=Viridothelium virens TaxID=1048519 RepID=A0A6A6H307_VIRVR|nr:hypothetical protein EV356DRAFT_248584 [Viridothelium virens]
MGWVWTLESHCAFPILYIAFSIRFSFLPNPQNMFLLFCSILNAGRIAALQSSVHVKHKHKHSLEESQSQSLHYLKPFNYCSISEVSGGLLNPTVGTPSFK